MCRTVEGWHKKFQKLMSEDVWAPGAILGYSLSEKDAECILCPWGNPEYERIGKKMKDNEIMLRAADLSGFLVTAVRQYLVPALDNFDTWMAMKPGVRYLVDHPIFRLFVPYEERGIVHWLKDIENEEEWYKTIENYYRNQNKRCFKGML